MIPQNLGTNPQQQCHNAEDVNVQLHSSFPDFSLNLCLNV
jgi:hypothetical protein